MIAMSVICGTLCSMVRPSASSAAAMSLSAEFLAPATVHLAGQPRAALDPDQIVPGRRRSYGPPSVTGHSRPVPATAVASQCRA